MAICLQSYSCGQASRAACAGRALPPGCRRLRAAVASARPFTPAAAAAARCHQRSRSLALVANAAQADASQAPAATSPQLPRTPAAMVDQAAAAVQAALDAGCLLQTVTLLLPINEKEADFNSTEPIDYPCSLQKVRCGRAACCCRVL